jgi:enoyl-CoA hydratase/carnithine racemase
VLLCPSPPVPDAPSLASPGSEVFPTSRGSIGLTVADGFAHLVLRREDTRNAISPELLAEVESVLTAVERVENVRLLVLQGEGKVFSVGADLAAVEALPSHEARDFFERGRALIRRLERLDALTVAAVNGLALGGGLELALACDLRWAHARAVFGFPEYKLGLIPAWGGIRFLHRLLPSAQAFEFVTRGRYIGVRAAHRFGLVSRIFDGPDFEGRLRAAIEEFRAQDAGALRALKTRSQETPAEARERWDLAVAAAFQELWSRRAAVARQQRSSKLPEPGTT